jgi:hypothetical protein
MTQMVLAIKLVDLPPSAQHEQASTPPALDVQATTDPRNPMLMVVPFTFD